MRIAVTGAAGHLGSHLCARLASLGEIDLIRIDLRDLPGGVGETRRADLSQPGTARRALEGAEVVVHCAAVHPWRSYSDASYIDLNVKGTWNAYRAAADLGIGRIVLTSSIAAVGYTFPPSVWPVQETAQTTPCDIYSLTKYAQEVVARHYAEFHGIETIALRPPAFMPMDALATGRALLGPFCLVDDIVEAHIAALKAEDVGSAFEPFFTTNSLPYGPVDADIAADTWELAERYTPGVRGWFLARDPSIAPPRIPAVYSVEKARRALRWEPQWSFGRWWKVNKDRMPAALGG